MRPAKKVLPVRSSSVTVASTRSGLRVLTSASVALSEMKPPNCPFRETVSSAAIIGVTYAKPKVAATKCIVLNSPKRNLMVIDFIAHHLLALVDVSPDKRYG